MKKIVAVAAFFLSALLLSAQDEGVRFGFQLSPTFSWMTANTNQINSSGTNLGLKMGMLGEFYFAENYAFSTGLGFAFNQGGTLQHERGGCYWPDSDLGLPVDTSVGCVLLPDGVKLKYKLQYLEIPITIKMRTHETGYIRYFLEPGLHLGISTQSTGAVEGIGVGNDAEKINIKNEVNPFNLSWGIAGGFEYSISETTALVGGLGFQIGVADITKDGGSKYNPESGQLEGEDNSAGKVRNITIKLAVMF